MNMKRTSLYFVGLASALSLSAAAGFDLQDQQVAGAQKISFAPKPGTIVTKTFKTVSSMETEAYDMLMGGEPIPNAPQMEMTTESQQTLKATDEYGAVSNGKIEKLTRTYDVISMTNDTDVDMQVMKNSTSVKGTSPLESKSIEFDWNPEEDAYDVSYAEGEDGDGDLLDGLDVDLDLAGLLPAEELEVGESYEIDPAELVNVLSPGGDMKLEMEVEGEAIGMGAQSPEQSGDMREYFEQGVEGDVTGTFKEMRAVEGVEVAVIELDVAIESVADLAEQAAEMGSGMPPSMNVEIGKLDMSLEYEGAGELLWNVAAGHIHSLTLSADMAVTMDMAMTIENQGEMSMKIAMVGTSDTTITTE